MFALKISGIWVLMNVGWSYRLFESPLSHHWRELC